MKKVAMIVVAVAVLFAFSSQAQAAKGDLSKASLSAMGLGNAVVMTDAQGEQVRGKGFVAAGGFSFAFVGNAGSANGAVAVGHHKASQWNISGAANSSGRWAIAGGASSAHAH